MEKLMTQNIKFHKKIVKNLICFIFLQLKCKATTSHQIIKCFLQHFKLGD